MRKAVDIPVGVAGRGSRAVVPGDRLLTGAALIDPPRGTARLGRRGVGRYARRVGRWSFTLTEMLVALAVMVLAMAIVTNVFSVTTRTASTSAAIAEVEALLRNFADQLQQDLDHCDPAESILVIHGRTQAAALTEDLLQSGQFYREMVGDPAYVTTGYDPRFDPNPANPGGTAARDQYSDPRADILMFFTNRPSVSNAPPTAGGLTGFQLSVQRGARVSPIQVVYGHAAIDTAVRTGGTPPWTFADAPRHIEEPDPAHPGLSMFPASRWHLARRATLIEEPSVPTGWDPRLGFTNSPIEFAQIVRSYSLDPAFAGDSAQLRLRDYLDLFGPGTNRWEGTATPNRAQHSPYEFLSSYLSPTLPWSGTDQFLIHNVLYRDGLTPFHHVATIIEQPPAALADNLGVHMLPGCVWFQVELLIPEDPRNGLRHPLSDQRRDTPRWVEVTPNETYVFVPDTEENRKFVRSQIRGLAGLGAPFDQPLNPSRLNSFAEVIPPIAPYGGPNTVANRQVRMWPYAIRVTARAIDPGGRLDQPIVRSVVHRFD